MFKGSGHIRMMVIGGSAGSFPVVRKILASLPSDCPVPLLFCLHRLKDVPNGLLESLEGSSTVCLREPDDKEVPVAGTAYLAPANYHMLLEPSGIISLSIGPEVHFSRPSIDLLFESAAHALGEEMLGLMLSGANEDGGEGMAVAHRKGALTVVQDPEEAMVRTMPESCLKRFQPDRILSSDEIVEFLKAQVS